MITDVNGKCVIAGCQEFATDIACGRSTYNTPDLGHPDTACYCKKHAREVADENDPEYIVDCPNCGCQFGVN